jgi:ABC-type branched-subunit amino acid transport system substrate-binding protein
MTDLAYGEPLNTPEKVAAGFRQAVDKLRADGRIRSPEADAFIAAAVRAADAMAASLSSAKSPDATRELMQKATILATASAGIMDGVLSHVADKSQLN